MVDWLRRIQVFLIQVPFPDRQAGGKTQNCSDATSYKSPADAVGQRLFDFRLQARRQSVDGGFGMQNGVYNLWIERFNTRCRVDVLSL
jgi:hypothetical protein